MWIASVFALAFLGFLGTSGIGAASLTLLAVPRWRILGRRGLAVAIVAALALWVAIAHRVDFAGSHAWLALASFGVAAGLPGLLAGRLLAINQQPSRKMVVAAVVSGLALWIAFASLLGFGLACGLDVHCDL